MRVSSTWNGSGKGKGGETGPAREAGDSAGLSCGTTGAKAVEVESL